MKDQLKQIPDLEQAFGIYPNFFKSSTNHSVNEMMWMQARSAYIELPLPSLLKEKIFVYLSKFCDEKYCLTRHVGFMLGLGNCAGDPQVKNLSVSEVSELLSISHDQAQLPCLLEKLNALRPIQDWNELNSDSENILLQLLPEIFLLTPNKNEVLSGLRSYLSSEKLDQLLILLNLIRSAHFWTQTRNDLTLENDIVAFLEKEEDLSKLINNSADLISLDTLHAILAEEKKRNIELENNARRWATAFENSDTGAWELDLKTMHAWRSNRHDYIFGYDEPLASWSFDDFLDHVVEEHKDEVKRKFIRGVEITGEWEFTCEIITAKNERRWIQAKGIAEISSKTGKSEKLLGTVRDITSDYYSKKFLMLDRENAIREKNLKSEFLRNMSHEIRTPMNSILSYSQMLRDENFSEEQKKDFIENINFSGKHLMSLIDDVLSYAKTESGRELRFVSIKLRPILRKIISSLLPLASESNTTLNLSVPQDTVLIARSNPTILRQIVYNLVSNAIKFTKNGTIDILLKKSSDGNYIELRIKDTGIGMSESFKEKLFMPFSQEDSSSVRKYTGVGIGLALSKKLANDLGGILLLEESTLNKGSTFLLKLPLHSEKSLTDDNKTNIQKANINLKNISILVAEDSVENFRILSLFLSQPSIEIDWAKNGKEAIEMVESNSYDIVLMDVQMPILDGYSATRAIKAKYPDLPIVALTAHALPEEFQSSMDAGCDDHLTKPVDKEELIQVINYLTQ